VLAPDLHDTALLDARPLPGCRPARKAIPPPWVRHAPPETVATAVLECITSGSAAHLPCWAESAGPTTRLPDAVAVRRGASSRLLRAPGGPSNDPWSVSLAFALPWATAIVKEAIT